MHKCNICGEEMEEVSDIELGGFLIRGWRCSCGNAHSNAEDVGELVKYFRQYKKGFKAKVFTSGNSVSIRIPKTVANVLRLKPKEELEIEAKKGKLILKT